MVARKIFLINIGYMLKLNQVLELATHTILHIARSQALSTSELRYMVRSNIIAMYSCTCTCISNESDPEVMVGWF